MNNSDNVERLESFFKAIAYLTLNHDVIDEHACVTANKLSKELEKIDPEWSFNVKPLKDETSKPKSTKHKKT